jgi:hypothetical protein
MTRLKTICFLFLILLPHGAPLLAEAQDAPVKKPASEDFDRAMALTQQFQMIEASALMQLEVCRGALSGLQPTSPKPIANEANQRKAFALLDQLHETVLGSSNARR